jgi:branched-chain amino acid transport system substrate-binding protein
LTGPLASITAEFTPGLELGVAAVNRRGGVNGHSLQLVVEDTQGSPQGGVASLRKVVQVDGVAAVITGFTNVVGAEIPLADQLRVPIVAPLEAVNIASSGQYCFSHSVTFPDIAPHFRDYWREQKAKRIYAFLVNNAYGQSIAPVVRDAARGAGADYDQAFVDFGTTDFRGVVTRAKEYAPDHVFISIQGTLIETAIIRSLRGLDVTAPIAVSGTFYQSKQWREGAGPYAEGVVFGGLIVDPVTQRDFIRAYRARMGFDPSYGAGEFYDIVEMLAWAIGKAGYNGEAIRGALLTMRGVPSVFGGKIDMKDNHYTTISTVGLWQVRRGELVAVR